MRKGHLLDCPFRGCAACGVFWDGAGAAVLEDGRSRRLKRRQESVAEGGDVTISVRGTAMVIPTTADRLVMRPAPEPSRSTVALPTEDAASRNLAVGRHAKLKLAEPGQVNDAGIISNPAGFPGLCRKHDGADAIGSVPQLELSPCERTMTPTRNSEMGDRHVRHAAGGASPDQSWLDCGYVHYLGRRNADLRSVVGRNKPHSRTNPPLEDANRSTSTSRPSPCALSGWCYSHAAAQ